jgi:PAS domain S-box-containing protein
MKSETSFPRFTSKHLLFVLISLALAGGVVGSFWVGKATDSRSRRILQERTLAAAVGMPIADVATLSGTARDANDPAYLRLKDHLTRLHHAAPDTRFYYLVRLIEGKIVFLCDSEPEDSPDYSPPGSVYEDEDPEFRAFVENEVAGTRGPQKDSWGVWISSAIPLFDAQGQCVAILAADVDAHYWTQRIVQFQAIPLLFSLLLSGFLLLLYTLQIRDERARRALTHMAEEQAFLFDKIETLVWHLKDMETFGSVNRAFAEFCGYPKSSIEYHPLWCVLTSDEELQSHLDANRRVFEGKNAVRSEEWHMDALCHPHLFQILRAPIFNASGEVEEAVCSAEDITELNRAHEALKESRRSLAAYFDNLPGLAYRCRNDNRWTIEFVSKGSQELTGYPPEAFAGDSPKTFMDLIPPEEQDRLWQIVQEANAERRHYEIRYPLLTASGERKWVWERGRGVFEDDGTVRMLEGLITDITEMRQAEQAVRLNEMRLEALLQLNQMEEMPRQNILTRTLTEAIRLTQSDVGYIAFVSPDERVLTLEACSDSAREGEQPEPVSRVETLKTAEPWSRILKQRQPLLCNDGSSSCPLETCFPPTRTPLQRTMNVPIFEGPKIAIVSGVANKATPYDESDIRQITLLMTGMWRILQRKQARQELLHYHEHLQDLVESRTRQLAESNRLLRQAKEAAEAANQAKSIFLASVTHELRTPLNAVLGFSQLMRDDPTLTEGQKENIETINRSGELLLDLINDVLEMSKLESGQTTRYDTSFDIRRMLLGVEELMRPHAQARRLAFRLELDPSLPLYVRTDEKRIKQILINLTGNAVKFTREGIVVIRAWAQEEIQTLGFEVQDTGPGIPLSDQERLFEPFTQARGNATGGVGLGLYISRKLVELLGGELTLRSEPGAGSLFSFKVPYELVADEDLPSTLADSSRSYNWLSTPQPPEILVCEDQAENREFLLQILQSVGLRTREAADGEQAVRQFEANRPDLILMDLCMPVLDGYEAIHQIRQQESPEKRVPIIVISATVSEENRQTLLLRGADDFIAKPFQTHELFDKLIMHLGRTGASLGESRKAASDLLNAGRLNEMLSHLPESLIVQLENALAILDLDGFKTFLPQVAEQEPVLGNELKRLAGGYEVAELAKIFNARKST